MMNHKVIRYGFVSSVWLFIALNGYQIVAHVFQAEHLFDAYPGGYASRVFIAPFFLFFLALFLWFRMFRWQQRPARIFAGLIGGYIWIMVIFVNLVVADLYDREFSAALAWLYACSGSGHLLYAFFGKER